ncbi:MAG: glycerophosphodiester phosphodiesterase [Gaiellaceae bacterium]
MGHAPASSVLACGRRPFLVAHRAGNRLADLRAAENLHSTLVEADVRPYGGKLEVRHLKTVRPLPILWDRWQVVAPWRPRLQLHELLAATGDETELMLDLKGRNERLAMRALAAIQPYLGRRRFTVCARRWSMLETFAGQPVRRVHSVGNARQLRRLLSRYACHRLDGVAIHERLLDAESVSSLRAIADVVMTWPVNRPERARELLRLGVHGLITDDAAEISRAGVLGATT